MICIRSLLFISFVSCEGPSLFFFAGFIVVCTWCIGSDRRLWLDLPRTSSFMLKFSSPPGPWIRDLSLSTSGVNFMPSTRFNLSYS
jgi:hypothetical protein